MSLTFSCRHPQWEDKISLNFDNYTYKRHQNSDAGYFL